MRDQSSLPISTQIIQPKALALIKTTNPTFKASIDWLRKFLCRHTLVLRAHTLIAKLLQADLEHKFHAEVQHVRKNKNANIPYELIANMDETAVFMVMVPIIPSPS